jgi:hypothetical protein
MTIYIVQGSTGEYSDRTDWIVCAYTDKEKADEHATKAEAWGIGYAGRWEVRDYSAKEDVAMENDKNPFDPNFRQDYTGTSYWVKECELIE